ncbi:hypothetical protein LPJ79_002635 [Coemansia sp. RSA 1821]|nr:hypothetical protein LPJ79_002635 [Coemansia sp. RSA 1821]
MQAKKTTSSCVDASADWSLTKIHGHTATYGAFKHAMRNDKLVIDKTLFAKAFFDSEASVVCISASAGFDVLDILSVLESFFNVLTLTDMPSNNYFYGNHAKPEFVYETAKERRAELFAPTLLCQQLPTFFNDYFCSRPVIRINLAFSCYDALKPEYAYKKLIGSVLATLGLWVFAFNPMQLNDKQKQCYDLLRTTHTEVTASLINCHDDWQDYKASPKELFDCLSDFVASISPERYIVMVGNCDMPFIELQGKSWEQQVRQILQELFTRMFKNNDRLLKALVVGEFAIPLDELGLDSTASMIPALNGCFPAIDYPLSSEQAMASMVGCTSSEVCEIAKRLNIDGQYRQLFDYYGGYSFGFKDARFKCVQAISSLVQISRHQVDQLETAQRSSLQRHRNKRLPMLRLPIPELHDTVKSIVRKASPELVLLVLRLISDYDHGFSSSFMWPSAEIMAQQRKNAELFSFVLDPSANPGNVNAESSLDKIATLLVLVGYLTIRSNVLAIPNDAMRNMWEGVRLSMTFGTQNQNCQDHQQRQLLNSLFNGSTSLLNQEFTSALQQISADGRSYSPKMQLEFACRILVSKLTITNYSYEHRPAGLEYDARFLVHPQFDTPWTVKLLPYGRHIQQLKLTFSFKNEHPLNSANISLDMSISNNNVEMNS